MVRLKVLHLNIQGITRLFQFHYGTIKSASFRLNIHLSLPFQFHYGTIKRISRFICANPLRDFNSTMVRLKDGRNANKRSVLVISIPLWYD